MLLSAVSVFVVAQSSSEIAEGLMNNPVHQGLDPLIRSVSRLIPALAKVSSVFQLSGRTTDDDDKFSLVWN